MDTARAIYNTNFVHDLHLDGSMERASYQMVPRQTDFHVGFALAKNLASNLNSTLKSH